MASYLARPIAVELGRRGRNMTERILCAAIFVETGKPPEPYRRSGGGPQTGRLFCGLRHSDCMVELHEWIERCSDEELEALPYESPDRRGVYAFAEQGFLTSSGRFVDRREAATLAREAGQVEETIGAKILTSEDLY